MTKTHQRGKLYSHLGRNLRQIPKHKKSHRVAVVGSRDWLELDKVTKFVKSLPDNTIIVSGGARGVDRVAEEAAVKHGLKVRVFEANWDKHGKSAGMRRNETIVQNSDKLVAFWSNNSRGTANSVLRALHKGIPVTVHLSNGLKFTPVRNDDKFLRSGNLYYAKGNIFDVSAQVIVNPCNSIGVAGAGLSKQIRDRYPAVYDDYHLQCTLKQIRPGMMLGYTPPEENRPGFIHFPTKGHWKNPSRDEYVRDGLRLISDLVEKHDIKSIAFPKLGCGLGGLKWSDVDEYFKKISSKIPIQSVIMLDF